MRRSHIVGRRGAAGANFYDRDAYGNIGSSIEGIAQRFTYTGSEFDAESGLYYYRARYYDPATGRLLAAGPIGLPHARQLALRDLQIKLVASPRIEPAARLDPVCLFRSRIPCPVAKFS